MGPIGLLVIQRTLRNGRAVGLATGLGVEWLMLMLAGFALWQRAQLL